MQWHRIVMGLAFLVGSSVFLHDCHGATIQIEKVTANSTQELFASNETRFGFYVFAADGGPQLAVMPARGMALAVLPPQTSLKITSRIQCSSDETVELHVRAETAGGVNVAASCGQEQTSTHVTKESVWKVAVPKGGISLPCLCELVLSSGDPTTRAVVVLELQSQSDIHQESNIELTPGDSQLTPPRQLPELYPEIVAAMVEWDWRQQDGLISRPLSLESLEDAIVRTIRRGELLIADLTEMGLQSDLFTRWHDLCQDWARIQTQKTSPDAVHAYESLWLKLRALKRQIAFLNPDLVGKRMIFVKNAPSIFSHQLTQYTGNCARPGGGIYVLEEPGQSMVARNLVPKDFPLGSYQFCDNSPDGRRILFSFCEMASAPRDRESALDRFFHLYELDLASGHIRKLTDGRYDHFAGKYLTDGRIVCVSTRRGGFHRCGRGPCPVHTLTFLEADGSGVKVASFHETHEWDPVQLFDGRILYTRWDYVDRNAVFYQQLWSTFAMTERTSRPTTETTPSIPWGFGRRGRFREQVGS
jgi:hypothetical protein